MRTPKQGGGADSGQRRPPTTCLTLDQLCAHAHTPRIVEWGAPMEKGKVRENLETTKAVSS